MCVAERSLEVAVDEPDGAIVSSDQHAAGYMLSRQLRQIVVEPFKAGLVDAARLHHMGLHYSPNYTAAGGPLFTAAPPASRRTPGMGGQGRTATN
jgi:hypothetical protein